MSQPKTIQELLDAAGYELTWPDQLAGVGLLPIRLKQNMTLEEWGRVVLLSDRNPTIAQGLAAIDADLSLPEAKSLGGRREGEPMPTVEELQKILDRTETHEQ